MYFCHPKTENNETTCYSFLFYRHNDRNTAGTDLDSERCRTAFLKQNLSLIAARYDMDIAQAQVLQARLFENPVISLEQNVYNRLNGKYFDMGKDGESGVEIEQVISIAGQRSNRIRLEKVNKEMAGYQFQEIMRTLHSELNERFVETYFLTRNMAVYEKEITSLERLLAEMKLQQQKGNISLMEASRLEAMLLSLKKERNEQENQLVAARGELNLLLSLPADARPELLLDESMLKQLDLSQLSYADLMARMTGRPDLKLARTYIRASQANLKLQKSLAFPEVSLKGLMTVPVILSIITLLWGSVSLFLYLTVIRVI